MFALVLLGVVAVVVFVLVGFRSSPKADPVQLSHLDLRSLSNAAAEISADQNEYPIIWAACFLKGDPQLDIASVHTFIEKKWSPKGTTRYTVVEGSHPLQRRLDSEITQLTFEPMTMPGDEPLPNRVGGVTPPRMPEGEHFCVVVTAVSEMGGAGASLHLSQAVLALIDTCPQVDSIYWEGSNQLFSRNELLHRMKLDFEKQWPVSVWVASHAEVNDNGTTTGYTVGLSTMGGTEFEAIESPERPQALTDRFDSLATYVVFHFAQILNEDTTGIDELEKIKLKKRPSETVHKGWVFQLVYLTASSDSSWSR